MPNLIVGANSGYDLSLTRRATYQNTFTLYTDATLSTEYDLTDCQVFAEIRKKDNGPVYLDLSPTIDVDPTTGIISIDIYISTALKAGNYLWDMLLITADDVRLYVVSGKVEVDSSITDDGGTYEPNTTGVDIQDHINNMHLRGMVTLPFGETEISTTLITPNRSGNVVRGHGAFISTNTNSSSTTVGSRSSIVADTNMTDLLRIRGAKQHWCDFNLMGDAYNTATQEFDKYGTKPDVGMLIYYDSGLGAGKHSFRNVNIQGFTTGVKFGQTAPSNNCDVTSFRDIRIENCDISVWQLGNQAIQNVFEGLVVTHHHLPDPAAGDAGTGICFLFHGGGNFRADDVSVVSPCVIHMLDQITGSYLGSNTSHYEYNNVKIDNGAGAGCKLFDSVPSILLRNLTTKAIFRNVYFAYDSYDSVGANGSRMGTVHGMQEVVIEHGYNLQPGAFNWRSYSGESGTFRRVLRLYNCKLRGCTLATDVLKITQSTGTMYFQAVNCSGLNNEHIDDYSGVVTGTGS